MVPFRSTGPEFSTQDPVHHLLESVGHASHNRVQDDWEVQVLARRLVVGFEQFSSVHFPQLEGLLGSQFNQPPTFTSSACGLRLWRRNGACQRYTCL